MYYNKNPILFADADIVVSDLTSIFSVLSNIDQQNAINVKPSRGKVDNVGSNISSK